MLIPKRCDVCDKELLLGSARYDVDIRVASSFDGYLPELDEVDATEESREDKMAKLLENLDAISPEEAEAGVYQEIQMTLCPECRRKFLAALRDMTGKELQSQSKKQPILLQ